MYSLHMIFIDIPVLLHILHVCFPVPRVSGQFFTRKNAGFGDRGPDVEPASPKEDIGYSSPSFESLEEIVNLTALTHISYTKKKHDPLKVRC